jgi:predicted CXXCH cytochrome family protein
VIPVVRASLAFALLVPAAYAQVSRCAPCHAAHAAGFQKTGMGRSFYSARTAALTREPYYHAPSETWFAMIELAGRVFQRRWQVGFDGKPANIEEKQIDFILGSGNHAQTFLHLTPRGTLQQLPLGWYAENGGTFAMNPGYDHPDYPGSTRAISYECMSCHNAYPKIPAANHEEGAEARYLAPLPEGIDCQRCHGPGDQHIATAGKAQILNPAALPPERALELCMQCHLETTSRLLPHSIRKHGRGHFSYVAGEPLADFELTFDRPAGLNHAVEVAGGAYRFRQSPCFLKSNGKLLCTTCHNPHAIPRGEAAAAVYNKVCATCHASSHRANENCVACHMPKTRTDDAVHILITDHRIQRPAATPADLTAAKAETYEDPATSYRGPVVPYLPPQVDPLYEAVAQVRDGSNLQAGLPLLASAIARLKPPQSGFYVDLGEAYRASGDPARAAQAFEQALLRSPASLVILLKLGNARIETRQWDKAEAALRRATLRAPADPLAWGLLGWALWQQGQRVEARADLEKAVKLNTDSPELHNYLGSLLSGTGDPAGAERAFREAVRIMPGIAEWRTNLARLLASTGQIPEARFQFERAVRLKPSDAAGPYEYARLLAALGEEAEAEKHARAAVEADPSMAAGHELWGALMINRGDLDAAVRELEAALKLNPNFPKAHYELAIALYSKGDTPAAVTHLKQAAGGGSAEAAQFLQKLLK